MNNWLENISECMVDGDVILKVSFEIIANFSFVMHVANNAVREKNSFTYDGNYQTKFELDLNGLSIRNDLEVLKCKLHEHHSESGYYWVDIICRYKLPDRIKDLTGYECNSELSPIAKEVCDFFIMMSILNDRVSILAPASLNLRIKSDNEWKRVTQIGGGQPHTYPCDFEYFEKIVKELPNVYGEIKKNLGGKKAQKIIAIYASGLRFQNNHFYTDAFLNFYKVIEIIFKDKSMFSVAYASELEKPKVYEKVIRQSNQKIQMLYIWEYLQSIDKEIEEAFLEKLLGLADTRNNLAHDNGEDLDLTQLSIVNNVARFMLHHFVLRKQTANKANSADTKSRAAD